MEGSLRSHYSSRIGREQDYPEPVTLELLSDRKWIIPEPVEVVIEKLPKYEQLAPKFKSLSDGGATINAIAAMHGMTWAEAKMVLDFAITGKRPYVASKKTTSGLGRPKTKYLDVAAEVARLRDDEQVSFAKIAERLGIGESTALRAYDHARPDRAQQAAESGKKVERGRYCHLSAAKRRMIREFLSTGMSAEQIAREVDCGVNTVHREKARMESEHRSGRVA